MKYIMDDGVMELCVEIVPRMKKSLLTGLTLREAVKVLETTKEWNDRYNITKAIYDQGYVLAKNGEVE